MQARPLIKLTSLDIRGLRALDSLSLPGPGVIDQLPDVVVIHGENGSGKTTLIEFIAAAVSCMTARVWPAELSPERNSWVEFKVSGDPGGHERVRFVIGSDKHLKMHKQMSVPSYGIVMRDGRPSMSVVDQSDWVKTARRIFGTKAPADGLPSVVYFPSNRVFHLPRTSYRAAGKIVTTRPFFHHWQPPKTWRDSLEAQLYSARWEDLNAREEGRDEDAVHFERYVRAFEAVTSGKKSLVWSDGELFVKINETEQLHDLSLLSSGEKQMLIFSAELRRWWHPGSLILIDEPELHLHTRWQVRLLETLTAWQRELGGQVVMTTISDALLDAAPEASRFVIGER